jgi:hypothetical protein
MIETIKIAPNTWRVQRAAAGKNPKRLGALAKHPNGKFSAHMLPELARARSTYGTVNEDGFATLSDAAEWMGDFLKKREAK